MFFASDGDSILYQHCCAVIYDICAIVGICCAVIAQTLLRRYPINDIRQRYFAYGFPYDNVLYKYSYIK
jgi:hypothetical protein